MERRDFVKAISAAAVAGPLAAGALVSNSVAAEKAESSTPDRKDHPMKIIVAADPFAVELKDAVIAHLKEKGHEVQDVGATAQSQIPYYEGAVAACGLLQEGKADRVLLFCGTGMGMSVVANKFKGITAACVESVWSAKMCRVINNANVLCMGAMIWGQWMALAAVDAFLETGHTQGLEQFADFLKDAEKKVEGIETRNMK